MKITRNKNSKRLRARHRNGRFAKATVEDLFGLRVLVCPHCRGFNTVARGESIPENCRHEDCLKPVAREEWK